MTEQQDLAQAIPTKAFFVSMLTRDISLEDAILDLLDNCIDGALRAANGGEVDYGKHEVNISLSEEEFSIQDNCGGIPREVAKNYAFKMGREPDDERDNDSETIGMYGVGMKRAIFKMGTRSTVTTHYDDDQYQVEFSPDWLLSKAWEPLPILTLDSVKELPSTGTVIVARELYPGVLRQFRSASFINELIKIIGEHFTVFLQKGMTIRVNRVEVEPILIEVLTSETPDSPSPFVFKKNIDGVLVTIVVGLNTGRRFDDDEYEGNDFEQDRSAATAGWSIFCNDRAVIVGNKTRLTGWGDGVPLYHGQFSVITGIVEFKSALADKLPITTTKRALDASSEIWLEARTKMREGLRVWINYTNDWKNNPRSDQSPYWESSRPSSLAQAVEIVEKRDVTNKQDGSIEYNPSRKKVLPVPATKKPSSKRITFSKPAGEIKEVSRFLFDNDEETARKVGEQCFDVILDRAREKEGPAS